MDAAKHTPGPWTYSAEENDGWKGRTYYVQIGAGNTLIASYDTAYVEYPDDATNKANARLMAAAPDLLEAARCAMNILTLLTPEINAMGASAKRVPGMVLAAITKATPSLQTKPGTE